MRRVQRAASEGSLWAVIGVALVVRFGAASPLHAQATVPVPLEDRSYELIDRLAAQLTLPDVAHDQRPYTRRQFALLTQALRDAVDALASEQPDASPERIRYLGELVQALEIRYEAEISMLEAAEAAALAPAGGTPPAGDVGGFGARVDLVRAEASFADSPFRGFTFNGLGHLANARINPLLDYRFGRGLVDGATGALEVQASLRAGSRLVAFGGPRTSLFAPRHSRSISTDLLELRTGAARLKAGRWAFQVGRAPVRRGQGRHAGLLFSNNAPPMDMVLIENEEAVRLPWLFRHLGPTRFSVLFADLGADQNFPHAKLYSNWLTFRPAERFELGGGFIVQDGGEGSPEQSIWERIGDYLIFVDVLFQTGSDFQASNKIAAIDFRWWVPGRAAVVYGELAIDDFRIFNLEHVREMLWPDAAHLAGITLPRLDGAGKLSGWAEFHHTGIRIYRHYSFASGVTRGRFLLGSAMGSDAYGIVGGLDFTPTAASTLELEAAWERLSHDEWAAPTEPQFHFELVADGPEEERGRVLLAWDHRPVDAAFGWRVEAGFERVKNFGFQQGETRNNAALHIGLEWAPRRRSAPAAP